MSAPEPISPSRGPLYGRLVVLLGGTGFVGRHVAQDLLSRGCRLRIVSRHPERAYSLKPLGTLGQIQFAAADVTRESHLAAVLSGAYAVVNLVGAFTGDLDAIQGKGAGRIARAARAAGAEAMVHVSAIGADADSSVDYARTKAEGEDAVLAAFPSATILRPSILFGPDDHFLNMFAGLIARFPALPVFAPQARLQPLFVDDAAQAIGNALASPTDHGGKTYEIAGPEIITMLDLNRRIASAQCRQRLFLELPDPVSGAIATLTGWLPFAPITRDQFALLQAGNTANPRRPGLSALGVAARPLGLFLDRWMTTWRKHGRFNEAAAGR